MAEQLNLDKCQLGELLLQPAQELWLLARPIVSASRTS